MSQSTVANCRDGIGGNCSFTGLLVPGLCRDLEASIDHVETLTTDRLEPIVEEAIRRWEATELTSQQVEQLASVQVLVGDLGANYLGMQYPATIWIDDDAAGWGWFVDTTPGDDQEFALPGNQDEQRRMDLLTVVMHELGHLLGHEHKEEGAMEETLAVGERHTELEQADIARVDQVLGQADDQQDFAWMEA